MASVIKPDSGELHILGAIKATTTTSNIGKLTIDNADDVDLNDLPANHAAADSALNVEGGAVIGGNLFTRGTLVANGDVITLGSSGGSLSLNANVNSDILPATNKNFDIGNSTNIWDKVYAGNLITPSWVSTTTTTASLTYMTDVFSNASPATVSLPDGEDGQTKMFVVADGTPSSPVVVTPTTPCGFQTITFTTLGESATLIYKASAGWIVMAVNRASVTL